MVPSGVRTICGLAFVILSVCSRRLLITGSRIIIVTGSGGRGLINCDLDTFASNSCRQLSLAVFKACEV